MDAILLKAGSLMLIIAIGYGIKRRGWVSASDFPIFSNIVLRITLPCALAVSFDTFELTPALLSSPLAPSSSIWFRGRGFPAWPGDMGGPRKPSALTQHQQANIGLFAMPLPAGTLSGRRPLPTRSSSTSATRWQRPASVTRGAVLSQRIATRCGIHAPDPALAGVRDPPLPAARPRAFHLHPSRAVISFRHYRRRRQYLPRHVDDRHRSSRLYYFAQPQVPRRRHLGVRYGLVDPFLRSPSGGCCSIHFCGIVLCGMLSPLALLDDCWLCRRGENDVELSTLQFAIDRRRIGLPCCLFQGARRLTPRVLVGLHLTFF